MGSVWLMQFFFIGAAPTTVIGAPQKYPIGTLSLNQASRSTAWTLPFDIATTRVIADEITPPAILVQIPQPTFLAGVRCMLTEGIVRAAVKEAVLTGALHQLPCRTGWAINDFKAALTYKFDQPSIFREF